MIKIVRSSFFTAKVHCKPSFREPYPLKKGCAPSFPKKWHSSLAKPSIDLSLGLVTPLPAIRTESAVKDFFSTIEQGLAGGVSYLQLWGPNDALQASLPIALELKKLAGKRKIPVIVNNCVDIALKVGLAGVHLGQKDLPYPLARQTLGKSSIIGLTVNKWEDVVAAQKWDVSYIGVQLFRSTHTKPPKPTDLPPWEIEGAEKVIAFSRHQIVLIGGITLETLPAITKLLTLRPGVHIAMAGGIMRASNPFSMTRTIRSLLEEKKLYTQTPMGYEYPQRQLLLSC